jgi:hypothetical protein
LREYSDMNYRQGIQRRAVTDAPSEQSFKECAKASSQDKALFTLCRLLLFVLAKDQF